MATYITYWDTTTKTNRDFMILNYVMVENFDELDAYFQTYQGTNPVVPNADCISIWNESQDYNSVMNHENDEKTLCLKYSKITNPFGMDQLFGATRTDRYHITGSLSDCKIKKIFGDLTRFNNRELHINRMRFFRETENRTLDNRLIFIKKNSIHYIFTNTDLSEWHPIFFTNIGSPGETDRICNIFRTFPDIAQIPTHNNDDQGNRPQLGFRSNQSLIKDNVLELFRQIINSTRQIIIQQPLNVITRNIRNILADKTSTNPQERIFTDFDGNNCQHWLGNIDKGKGLKNITAGYSFRTIIRDRRARILLNSDPNNLEKIMIFILTITATNGLMQNQNPCRVIPVQDSDSSSDSSSESESSESGGDY